MNKAMYAAASGMAAQQLNLEVIANNLANADVAGFKGAVASFTDLGAPGSAGLGTTAVGRHMVFEQGKLEKSSGPFDVALDGTGFFAVSDQRGRCAYTRDGEFSRFPDGTLRNAQGWRLRGVRVPGDANSIGVNADGAVIVDNGGKKHAAGRLQIVNFAAPERLQPLGATLFAVTDQSGSPRRIHPGADGATKVVFGMLERSNVSIVEAMMQILAAQRAYEANAKGVQAADEMMRIANNLHRG